jgi:cytoskeletal protein CcmA (bactofilin family)
MPEREISQRDLTGIGEINALLGRGTRFEGKLAFEGRVRIDGYFRGEIYSEDVLILGEGADVEANIEVATLIVRGGSLRGRVHATRLIEIYPPGRVFGELRAPQVFVDKGVHFEGSCSMTEASGAEGAEGMAREGAGPETSGPQASAPQASAPQASASQTSETSTTAQDKASLSADPQPSQ